MQPGTDDGDSAYSGFLKCDVEFVFTLWWFFECREFIFKCFESVRIICAFQRSSRLPTKVPDRVNKLQVRQGLGSYYCLLRVRQFFGASAEIDAAQTQLRPKLTWTPLPNLDRCLNVYIAVVTDCVVNALNDEKRLHRKMTRDVYQALQDFKKLSDIIIEAADEGGVVVVMTNTSIHIQKAYVHWWRTLFRLSATQAAQVWRRCQGRRRADEEPSETTEQP